MSKLSRSQIREDLLTLEDAALLADPKGQVPADTMARARRLIRTDPRVTAHFEFLEYLADEAEMPGTSDRLHVGLKCLEQIDRLERAKNWQHPGEVLDPTGEVGISYPELVQLAEMQARQDGGRERYRAILSRLEKAWSEEKAGDALAERFATRLCDYQPAEAERLLRQAARRYQMRREERKKVGS